MRGKTNPRTWLVVSVFLVVVLGISGYCEAQEPFIVADINPGAVGSIPGYLTNVNGTLFFSAENVSHGRELWKSNGTEAGTVMVADINPGAGGSDPYWLTNVNGTLFFQAYDGTHGRELWKSDGTEAGTVLVMDIYPGAGDSSPWRLANVNGTLFFVADDGTGGWELWKSDGTNTVMVMNFNPFGGLELRELTNVNGTLFFSAYNDTYGYELWKSDGTIIGTMMVMNINPSSGSSPGSLTNVNGTLFFRADNGTHGRELWKSDGTSIGTVMVADINPSGYSDPWYLTNVNGTLFFNARDGTYGEELWKSDGTRIGTEMVADINPGDGGSNPSYLTNVNGTLFFRANNGTNGYELWKSDGTSIGTVMVMDIFPHSDSSSPSWLTNVNGTLFFGAYDGTHGYELWKSYGTEAGTEMVADINPGTGNSYPLYPTNVNGTLFFRADDGSHGYELWAYTHSNRIFVDAAAEGANDGSSWGDAYLYLQDALTRAGSGNEIFVAEGTYKPDANTANPTGTGDREAKFELINGVALYGGYAGFGEPDPNARDIELYETILSGDIGTPGDNTDNSYYVVISSASDPSTILDGFTITGSNASDWNWGGGMLNWSSSLTVTNCTFSGNYASGMGGGMCNNGTGSPTVTNCTFSGNSAGGHGGGMYNVYSSPTVTNCTFSGNSASGAGGGMYNSGNDPTVTNCMFSGNEATVGDGGGMYNNWSNPTVTNCTFSGNSTSGHGGGMLNSTSNPTLTNCILWGNSDSGGYDESAQFFDFNSTPTINYSCVQGWTGSFGGTGNIGDDPMFKDADGPDNIVGTEDDNLRLLAGSPCIDAGDNLALPADVNTDLAGAPRIAGWSVDMGAYEFYDHLVAHWKLDEGYGTTARDSSGNGHHGTLYGEPNWKAAGGRIAGALQFDGVDDYVNAPHIPFDNRSFTIAMWVNPVLYTAQQVVFAQHQDGSTNLSMHFRLGGPGGIYPNPGAVRMGFYDNDLDTAAGIVADNTWYHITFWYDFENQTRRIYMDGVQAAEDNGDPYLGTSGDTRIGQWDNGGQWFRGIIDDVRIYNYALSGDEVRWLLCARPPRGDLNRDCRVDFVDFAILASGWLDCGFMVQELCGQ